MGLLDEAKPTPRNRFLGLLADAAQSADEYANAPGAATGGKANPPLAMLADLLGVGSVARTLDRLSYGEPITNYGKANVPLIPQDTAAAAMAAIPVAQGLGKGAVATAKFAGPKAAGMAENYMARSGLLQPATVWHGSPHKFDRFDSSKIGTGEGAQAYGHGMYLAESPAVAQTYKDLNPTALSAPIRAFRGAELTPGTPEYHAATLLDGMGLQQARKQVAGWIATARPEMAREAEGWKKTLETLNAATSKSDFKTLKNTGNLYKVDLPDSAISRMLDWDKPLSQQAPEVQKALQSLVGDVTGGGFDLTRAPRNVLNAFDSSALQAAESKLASKYGATKTQTGWLDKSGKPIPQDSVDKLLAKFGGKSYENAGQLYNDLSHIVGSQSDVSATLRNLGVPGIQYLDGGSRGFGVGTKNYVVFPGEEGLLNILERNGRALP